MPMFDPIFHMPPFVMVVLLVAAGLALVSLVGSFFQPPRKFPPPLAGPTLGPAGGVDRRCASCSTPNPPFAKFCRQCGRRL